MAKYERIFKKINLFRLRFEGEKENLQKIGRVANAIWLVRVLHFSFYHLRISFGCISQIKGLENRKESSKIWAPKISSKQLDAFCWFAFLSLTSMGILLPIVAHLITSFTSSKVIFNNPLWEISFIFFYSLGLMLIPGRLRINEHGGFSVELRRSFYEIILFFCWISPFKAVKRGEILLPFISIVGFPLLFFYFILKVSPALIISIIPFLLLFSVIFDLSKAEKNTS